MAILKKIQQQPEGARKAILWTTVILVGIVLLFFWWKGLRGKESFDLGKFKEDLNLPSPGAEDLFEINEE